MMLTKEENWCLFKSFLTFDFRGLWYGRKSCESLWSSGTPVVGTLHSHKLSCKTNNIFLFSLPCFHSQVAVTVTKIIISLTFFSFPFSSNNSWKIIKMNLRKWRTWLDKSMLLIWEGKILVVIYHLEIK